MMLTTIWSAPNFLYKCENVGAILEINEANTLDMFPNTFQESPESQKKKPLPKEQKDLPDYYV